MFPWRSWPWIFFQLEFLWWNVLIDHRQLVNKSAIVSNKCCFGVKFPTTMFRQSNCLCTSQIRNTREIKLRCILIKLTGPSWSTARFWQHATTIRRDAHVISSRKIQMTAFFAGVTKNVNMTTWLAPEELGSVLHSIWDMRDCCHCNKYFNCCCCWCCWWWSGRYNNKLLIVPIIVKQTFPAPFHVVGASFGFGQAIIDCLVAVRTFRTFFCCWCRQCDCCDIKQLVGWWG